MVVWTGIHKGRKTSLVASSGWKRQRLCLAGYSRKYCFSHQGRTLWKQHSLQDDVCPLKTTTLKTSIEIYKESFLIVVSS